MLNNIHEVQRSGNLPLSKELTYSKAAPGAPNLDIEMETGTGKTYVYIKTIMDVADHPLVGVTWNCNRQDIVDLSIEKYYRPLAAKVRCLHIHDLYEDYPYRELFRILKETRFDGFCLTELPESAEPERFMKTYNLLFREWTR